MHVYAAPEAGARIEAMDIDAPELSGSEVLIDVTHSGVCHSDVHCREGFFDLGSAGKLPLSASGVTYPAVFGHEIVGTVAAAGPDAKVRPGDEKFIVFPWIGCGKCQACREDRENYCPQGRNLSVQLNGGYAEQVWVPDERYLIPLGDLDSAWGATLACSGVTSYSAVNKVLPRGADDTIAVIGAGGVGLMAVALLHALGHRKIAAVDVNDDNLAAARELGATVTFNSRADDPVAGLVEAAGGRLSAAIDFVNNGATASMAMRALEKGGTLVSVGLCGGEHTYPTTVLALNLISILGNFVGSLPELKALVELAKSQDLPRLPIAERPMSADAVNEALDALEQGRATGRTVLTN